MLNHAWEGEGVTTTQKHHLLLVRWQQICACSKSRNLASNLVELQKSNLQIPRLARINIINDIMHLTYEPPNPQWITSIHKIHFFIFPTLCSRFSRICKTLFHSLSYSYTPTCRGFIKVFYLFCAKKYAKWKIVSNESMARVIQKSLVNVYQKLHFVR